jgi:hypothetical protein
MVKLLVFNGGFARYRRFGVLGLHEHFDPIAIFFWDLEMTYTYDLATTPAGTGAGGCLTAKKGA